MKVYMRIYTSYDRDLAAISASGINLGVCLKDCLQAYARGKRHRLNLQTLPVRDVTSALSADKTCLYIRVTIQDASSIEVLKAVRPRCRNAFCKALLRDSIAFPSLSTYFAAPQMIAKEEARVLAAASEAAQTGVLAKPEELIPVYAKGRRKAGGAARRDSSQAPVVKAPVVKDTQPAVKGPQPVPAVPETPTISDEPLITQPQTLQTAPQAAAPEAQTVRPKQEEKPDAGSESGKTDPEDSPEEFVDLDDSADDGQSIMDMFNSMLGQV